MERDLIRLISIALNNNIVQLSDRPNWSVIMNDAERHGVIAALYTGVSLFRYKEGTPSHNIENKYYSEFRWDLIQQNEINKIQSAFEANEIYSLALKGSNTKYRYPQTILRSMGDIDILIKPEQNMKVRTVMKKLGYSDFHEGRKHDHYKNNQNIAVEIHRDMLSTESEYYDYYNDIWNRCRPKQDHTYTYEMSIEDESIFNILHLTEHFKNGGIGIRFIMDVYVYNRLVHMDHAYVTHEFEKLGIYEFVKNISNLADFWFGKVHFERSERIFLNHLGEYIYNGGTFGCVENSASLKTKDGKWFFLIHSIFPRYDSMLSIYPWLKGKRILLPVAWLIRGIRALLFRRGNIRSIRRTAVNANTDRTEKLRRFYSECGLKI